MHEAIKAIARKRWNWVEASRENEFESGLKRLLTVLYPDNAHFIYELLQNAEDARAQEVRFILHEDRIEFEHNGPRLFSIRDVDAITSIGFSTKPDDATNIGKFGVGFKAVFAFTDTPEIESGEFHFRIRDMVVPETDGLVRNPTRVRQTRFIFPFNNSKKAPARARTEIEVLLRALDATTLLFLSHIRKIEYLLPDTSLGYIERIEHTGCRLEFCVQQPGEPVTSSTHFLKFDREVQVEDEEEEDESVKLKSCRIAVAFKLSQIATKTGTRGRKNSVAVEASPEWELVPIEPGRVCIYFPADKETSNLRFHLHAPFPSTVARDSVRDCAGSNALRNHLCVLLAESMHSIRDQGLLNVRFLAVLPNDKDNLSSFYDPLRARLVKEFQEHDLVPMKNGGHAAASGIFRGTKALSDLIDDEDLVAILRHEYFTPMWVANPPQRSQREDSFLSMLRIDHLSVDDLVKALTEMQQDTLWQWMGGKDDEWHQSLYETLMDYFNAAPVYPFSAKKERIDNIANLSLVRCTDEAYRVGGACFFPTEGVKHDDRFPRVANGVYISDQQENEKARRFLEAVGVRMVDEKVEIERILKDRYSQDAVDRELFSPEVNDIARFVAFSEAHPLAYEELFLGHYIFKLECGKWGMPEQSYIDMPFMDTGLRAWFDAVGESQENKALSSAYANCGIEPAKIGKFAEALKACHRLAILSVAEDANIEDNPKWGFLNSVRGDPSASRSICFRRDWKATASFRDWLQKPTLERARLVWRQCEDWSQSKEWQASRQKEKRYGSREAPSQFVYALRAIEWVPQKHGKEFKFVQPRDAVAEKLPEGFEYQTGLQWLQDIGFGSGIRERKEAQRREQERQTQEYKHKEQVAMDVGFDSLEEAEKIARLKNENPEAFRKLLESEQSKAAFPERLADDPDRRKAKAVEAAVRAPQKQYERKQHSVRTSRTQGKAEVEEYLRNSYTNDAEQLICQICHNEMPFRKKDDEYYFERVELFDLPQEHGANHLALCPVCAAKYDEFVFHGPDDARDKLRHLFVEMGDALELPVMLGKEAATIRFVQRHAIDLRAAVSCSDLGI